MGLLVAAVAKVLFNGEWYEPLASSSLYESEFEDVIEGQAGRLFPGYHLIPFKKRVASEEEARIPDFALIDHQYRDWWVVEIELAHHPFEAHVLPQVRTLSRAFYGREEAAFLSARSSALDANAVLDMMKGAQPKVAVIVNAQCPHWVDALESLDARVIVVEMFRSDRNRHLFVVDGKSFGQPEGFVSSCWLDPTIPRLLVVESPAAIGVSPNTPIKIWYRGGVTEWWRMDAQDRVWLNPKFSNPLSAETTYQLVRLTDGALELREYGTKQKRKGVLK